MATEIRIKRSAVSGSVPTHSTNINTGEIALNMADRNMYYSDGTTVKHIKGHHIGTSAPTTPTPVEGDIWYDTTNNVLKSYDGSSWASAAGGLTQEEIEDFLGTSFLQAGNGVTMTYDDTNNELLIESDTVEETVKNVSGGSLSIGTVVYQSGSTGTIAEVQAADADVASKMPAIGILAETLADQAEGKMVLMGKISGLNTSSFTAGDTVYVSTTAGALTTTPPTGETGLIQNIGKVIKVHASNGVIVVTGAGRTNATPNLDSGKFFLGNGSNQAASATFSTEVQTVGDARYSLTSHNHSGVYEPADATILKDADIGVTVQGYSSVLANTTASYTTAEETKLAGIEAGATADQTASEILTAIKTVDGSGSGLDADLLDGVEASGFNRFYNNAVLNSSTTTANLISELTNDYGCFNNNSVTLKVQWSYAGSSDLVTGHSTIGTIELAGCTIEAWGGTYKHIRITRPNTGTGGHGVYEYNDQGASYSPGWREIWTSESDGSGSGLDADLLDGVQGSSYLRSDTDDTFTTLSGTALTLGSGVELRESTDRADLLQITSNTSGWGGLQIRNSSNEGRWSFMTDGSAAGIYDDENSDWRVYMTENASVQLRYNNAIKLETTSGGVTVTGTVTATDFNTTSDRQFKTNITTIEDPLNKVTELRGVEFDWIDSENHALGFIAQEVEEVIPDLVTIHEDGTKSVKYSNMTAVLVEAIKELKAEVDDLKKQLNKA